MKIHVDYTSRARKFALTYPYLNSILIQISFWVWAYIFFAIILYLNSMAISHLYQEQLPISFTSALIMSIIFGFLFGTALGSLDFYFDQSAFRGHSLGFKIIIRGLAYYIILVITFSFLRFIVWDLIIAPIFLGDRYIIPPEISWKYYYLLTSVYAFMMTLLISFIKQMNQKFGPGVLLPMLFGKYKTPKEEHRIFMFMDLKSSTSHAEKLGHLNYSALIRDCFIDINRILFKYNAEIYQYVGDEVVISWPSNEGLRKGTCIEFFFACQRQFESRQSYYSTRYNLQPEFKAGLHVGSITAVEVGDIKRDIAYHGDVLNTAARIQGICNQYGKFLLVSEELKNIIPVKSKHLIQSLGPIALKGKNEPVNIYSVEFREDSN